MAASINFRSALNGFNRTDVVQYIQNQTSEHVKEVQMLQEANTRLRQALDASRAETDELRAAMSAMLTVTPDSVEAQEAPVAHSEFPVAEVPVEEAPAVSPLDAPIAPAATVVSSASDFNELELAAYRRAEMTERMARERATASANRMKAVFSQADEKLILTSKDFATLIDTFRNDFEKMEQLLATTRGIVDESASSLKAVSDLVDETD